jgi:hypothetical protein
MTTVTDQRRAHYDTFVTTVRHLCEDNRTRVDLSLGRGQPVEMCHRLHRHLSRLVAGHGAKRAHYTVASLIAQRRPTPGPAPATTPPAAEPLPGAPMPGIDPAAMPPSAGPAAEAPAAPAPWWSRPNLGATLATAVRDHGFNYGPTEQRLHTLTRLESDLLHPRLRSLAEHLLGAGVPVDWAVLLEDLAWWDYDRDAIATRWQESFYLTVEDLSPNQEL